MSRVNPQLLKRLQTTLGLGKRQVNNLINDKARERFLPRSLAAIALAAEQDIPLSKYATADDLAALRAGGVAALTPAVSRSVAVTAIRTRTVAKARQAPKKVTEPRRGTSVFVVHGRNEQLRKAMFAFLRSVGLNPVEWRQAIPLTGKGSPFVAEILDVAFREAVAVVVMLTPDDEVRLKPEFRRTSDKAVEKVLTGQARPNVLFEAGLAFGRNPDSTVLVQIGDVKEFSDVGGRHVVRLSNSTQSRQELVTKLANAGCNVQIDGTDWHTEGDFGI